MGLMMSTEETYLKWLVFPDLTRRDNIRLDMVVGRILKEVSLWEQGWQELQEEEKSIVCEEADVSQLRKIDTSAPGESLLAEAEQGTLVEDLKEGGGVR